MEPSIKWAEVKILASSSKAISNIYVAVKKMYDILSAYMQYDTIYAILLSFWYALYILGFFQVMLL